MASHLEISQALPAELSEKARWPAENNLDLGSRNPVVETSELAYKVNNNPFLFDFAATIMTNDDILLA
jgi:hypothetical protein